MEHPRITVGMPVYNDPDGLRRSIPSVFGQTWQGKLRLLVVDDGSTDETPDVLAALADVYSGIEVIRTARNRGRPFARNMILEHAGDGYLAWIDAGDLWHPRKLTLQMATLLDEEKHDPETPLLCTGPLRWVFADRGDQRIRVSDVGGDQLHSALTGALLPYLGAIVGRAEHFRRFGGFDERLLRRQDYDFLVRTVAEGGRVVSTPKGTTVFTYVKSDVGSAPHLVADANRIIRVKHRPYYRRYGRVLARMIRSNQDRLVCRFYRHNGDTARSLLYRARARLEYPDLLASLRRVARRIFRVRPTASGLMRLLARLVRPLVPLLRRLGVIEFARRSGALRILAAAGVSRAVYDEVKSATNTVDVPLRPAGTVPPSIAALEAEISSAAGAASSHAWQQLEKAYRTHGMLHSAESALTRGLALHPRDGALLARLIELLALRTKWAECLELWNARGEIDQRHLRGLTYVRVARAFRQLGSPDQAHAVVSEGLRRWPDEPRLLDESHINRALLVDWRSALVPADWPATDTAAGSVDLAGVVTDLGFLAGEEGPVEGHITSRTDGMPSISLVVNGVLVATTHAAERAVAGPRLTFSLSGHELLRYLGDGDVVWLESDGRPVRIDGLGLRAVIRTGYRSRFPELRQKLSDGYLFTKFGALRLGNTQKRKDTTLALVDEVSALLARSHGYLTFPLYGNLLGAVREHDFIPHDIGGFDLGYLSRHSGAEQVRAEFVGICRTLLAQGYHLVILPWSAYVRARRGDRVFVDLNYAWFTAAGELNLSYGWRSNPVTDRDGLTRRRESLIGGRWVRIPGNAEDVLTIPAHARGDSRARRGRPRPRGDSAARAP